VITGDISCSFSLGFSVCDWKVISSKGLRIQSVSLIQAEFLLYHAGCINVIILPAILYGCETWSVILREEHRLRVFENRVLRRIFGPKRDEVTGMEKVAQ
jgi:hypothetical protein